MEGCLDRLAEEAVGVIERGAEDDAPFFLYFALTSPHKPVWPAKRFQGATELGPYGDFVTQTDDTVGRVLDALDEAGVVDETLVIFTSDNGSFMYRRDNPDAKDHLDDETIQAYRGDRHRSNHVYRGTKADIWEAGHRVPFFVRWPGHAPAGESRASTITHTDIFATLRHVVDEAARESGAPVDGFSFWSAVVEGDAAHARPPVVHHSVNGTFALRKGPWKLVFSSGSGGANSRRGSRLTEGCNCLTWRRIRGSREMLPRRMRSW